MTTRSARSGYEPRCGPRDSGFTLIEVTIVVVIMGVLMAALSMAVMISLKATPSTEDRIDDARATRSLATWLSHDTTSAPPFLPETDQGGIITDSAATADNNDCGGDGLNLLHLQWTEAGGVPTTFVSNYRFVTDNGKATIVRYTCFKIGPDPFQAESSRSLTPSLDPLQTPVVTTSFDTNGLVEVVSFSLIGRGGETVQIDTSSRNPADFFP